MRLYFLIRREIARAKQLYPDACYVGAAAGAAANWQFLEQHIQHQMIYFFHATEYVSKIAQARRLRRRDEQQRARWQDEQCSTVGLKALEVALLVRERIGA